MTGGEGPRERHGAHHLLILLPGLGVLVTRLLAAAQRAPEGRAELLRAARWQELALGVIVLHAALQGGIAGVARLYEAVPPSYLDASPITAHVPLLLSVLTRLNLGAGAAEWLGLVAFAARAWSGHPYPDRGRPAR